MNSIELYEKLGTAINDYGNRPIIVNLYFDTAKLRELLDQESSVDVILGGEIVRIIPFPLAEQRGAKQLILVASN